MDRKCKAADMIRHPYLFGREVGYSDLTELHDSWMRMMLEDTTQDMTLQAHRGSYKTTCLCIVIALMMIRYRDRNIMFLRKTDNDVAEVVRNVVRILSSDLMRDIYFALTGARLEVTKATFDEVTTSAFCKSTGSSQLLGIGIGGSLTGKHADIIITDDIVNLRDRQSRAERERTISAYRELQNVKNRGGRIINTGTPWHKDDAFALMPYPRRFDCYTTGLISREQLEKLRRSMSPSLFAANYELRHIASQNALFSEAPTFTDDAVVLRDGICHIDAAYGGEDFTAVTMGSRIGDTMYLYGRLYKSHIDTVMDAVIADAERMMCAPIYCETNGDKGYLARQIRRRDVPVRAYAEKQNKYSKISTYLRKWWTRIVWVEGTDPEYISQIMDYNEQAAHDDAPDSAACVCRLLDRREV